MGRHFAPFWVPVGAIAFAAAVIYGISRVLLSFNKETTPIVALFIALVILVGATLLATRVSSAQDVS